MIRMPDRSGRSPLNFIDGMLNFDVSVLNDYFGWGNDVYDDAEIKYVYLILQYWYATGARVQDQIEIMQTFGVPAEIFSISIDHQSRGDMPKWDFTKHGDHGANIEFYKEYITALAEDKSVLLIISNDNGGIEEYENYFEEGEIL
jgi:hypothetical protein